MAEKKQAPLNKLLTIIFTIPASHGKATRNGKNINSPDTFYTDFLYWRITEYTP